MGCSSSKSTPTVEDQSPTAEDLKNNVLKNGRALADDIDAKLDEAREAARNAGENLESTLFNSPETERAGNLNDAESTAENHGSDMSDSDTMRKSEDDSDGLLNTDKPSTPMPENRSLSDETLCNENDETESYTSERRDSYASEQQSGYGGNIDSDTLKSNIYKAVCNTAANVAMEDTDTEDCSESNDCRESIRTNTMGSDCSQNSMKTNCQLSGRSSPESIYESENCNNRHRRGNAYSLEPNTRRTNYEESYDDTYKRLGRKLWNELENNQNMRTSIPSILEMVKKVNAGGRFTNINGNMGLNQNTKSISRPIKYK